MSEEGKEVGGFLEKVYLKIFLGELSMGRVSLTLGKRIWKQDDAFLLHIVSERWAHLRNLSWAHALPLGTVAITLEHLGAK